MEYFIGIDIGTTNAKAVAMTAAGRVWAKNGHLSSIQKLLASLNGS
jgi:sugar (pentulose or hexulose) kinase